MTKTGWDWFGAQDADRPTDNRIKSLFEATFACPAGAGVLAHLRQLFLERRLPPAVSDAELRHVEGARTAVAYIERLARPREGEPIADRFSTE